MSYVFIWFCNALGTSSRYMSNPAGHASSRKRATATHCSDELLPHGRQRPTHARSPTADPLNRRAGPSTPTADPRPPLGPPTHGLLARPRDGLSPRACRATLPSRRPTLAQRFPWPSAPRDPPSDPGCARQFSTLLVLHFASPCVRENISPSNNKGRIDPRRPFCCGGPHVAC